MKVYRRLANLVVAIRNCEKSNNREWYEKHSETVKKIVEKYLPSGSGFNSGTTLLLDCSSMNKLMFESRYEPMNENGYYYEDSFMILVTMTPNLALDYDLNIGYEPDRQGYKDEFNEYFNEVFCNALDSEVEGI